MLSRQPFRWLIWGATGFGGGLLALSLAIICLVVLIAASIGASSPPTGETDTTAQISQPSVRSGSWTGARNEAVVLEALRLAAALYTEPPDNFTTWYHADQIPDAVAYWKRTCTEACAQNWQEGNLQCTMLVTASYGLAGQDLPFAGDAVTFVSWHPYRDRPGWQEVAPTEQPIPGDILVWDSGSAFGGAGHVALIVDVKPPDTSGQGGYVRFAQANSASAIAQEPLSSTSSGQLHMQTWSGYTVLGYIRHTASMS